MDQPKAHRLKGYGVTQSALRIESQDGRICGAGVAVSPRHVVTCTHVVLAAIDLQKTDGVPVGVKISLTEWSNAQPLPRKAVTLAHWRPVAAGDLALLELMPDEKDLVPACCQMQGESQWSQSDVEAFGFPKDFDDTGQWADLSCHNTVQDGRVQCSPEREGVSKGHSGGPVFKQGELLGIVQARRRFKDESLKYDYIVPTADIQQLCALQVDLLRQPYYDFAQVLSDEENRPSAELLREIHNTSPHSIREYQLQRRAKSWDTLDIRLDFTPLKLLLEDRRKDVLNGSGPDPIALNNLNEALGENENYPFFLLKGAPGGGKTTLLKRLALDRCTDSSAELPILIELGNHRGKLPPAQWLAQVWATNFSEMPALDQLSTDFTLLWLLDGLNELPVEAGESKEQKIRAWRDWLSTQSRHRTIISCRSADYLDQLDTVDGSEVPHLELQPMDIDKISEFLRKRSKLKAEQAEDAIQRIQERSLASLYSTPLMLTLLEQVLIPQGHFPEGRIGLFSAYLCRLLVREYERQPELIEALLGEDELMEFKELNSSNVNPADQADIQHQLFIEEPNLLFKALSQQAYRRQSDRIKGERQEVIFSRRDLKKSLREEFSDEQCSLITKASQALNLLVTTESRGQLRFLHQQFQEFFAALRLVKTQEVELAAAPYRPEQFHQSLEAVRSEMASWQQLPDVDRSGWEETVQMAAEWGDAESLIIDLAEVNLPLAAKCVDISNAPFPTRNTIAEKLHERMRDDRCDLRARIAAGKALGELEMLEVLGYTAIRDEDGALKAWLPPIETIPGGEYIFGSEDDPEGYSYEHRFSKMLEPFQLGRFPVTVAEWRCFKQDRGYLEPTFWPGDAASQYRQQGSQQGNINIWKFWHEQHEDGRLESQLEQSSMDLDTRELIRQKVTLDQAGWDAHLSELRSQAAAVTEPAFWQQGRYTNPLQPVVGISLFEALAYCCWLSQVTGQRYILPNELQWEAAARGLGDKPRRFA